MIIIEVLGIQVKNIENAEFEELLKYVSPEKCKKILRYKNYYDGLRTLLGDILVRGSICQRFNILNDDIKFGSNIYGKPYLENIEDFHFNISHSEEWVVCALDSIPVGIDIEYMKLIDINEVVSFFSKDEQKDIFLKDDYNRIDFFYDMWTLKESYIKLKGNGLSIPLNSFTIHSLNNRQSLKNSKDNVFFNQYSIDRDYKLSVCSPWDKFPHNIKILDLSEVKSMVVT